MVSNETVTVGCPVRDRDWILEDYWRHIYNLDYPKSNIDILFVVNDSSDGSESTLLKLQRQHHQEYRSFEIKTMFLGAPRDRRDYVSRLRIYRTLPTVRNEWLSKVKPGNYAFSVDSDIFVKPNTLSALVSRKVDICAAFINNEPKDPKHPKFMRGNILRWTSAARVHVDHIRPVPLNSFIPVDVTGAVYLLSPKVVEGVRYGYDPCGEDLYFCREAAQKGFKAYCDTSQTLTHVMDQVGYLKCKQAGVPYQSR